MPGTRRPRPVLLLLAAAALAAGAGLGAWIDWTWWSPVYGVQVLAIGAVIIALVIAVALRRRFPALLAVAVGATLGLALGLGLGPSREAPEFADATMTVRLERPAGAGAATMEGSCSVVPSRDHISVTGGEGSDPVTLPDGRGLSLWVTVGDMWSRGPWARPDHLAVHGIITPSRGTPIADDGFPTEIRVTSTPRSQLSATLDGLSGSMRFSGLESYEDGKPEITTPFDLAGTLEWTCEEPRQNPTTGAP